MSSNLYEARIFRVWVDKLERVLASAGAMWSRGSPEQLLVVLLPHPKEAFGVLYAGATA